MRVILAGIAGGIVVFVWGFVSHVLLPVGEMGMRAPGNEDAVIAAAKSSLSEPGIYYVPYIASDRMEDEAASKAWAEKAMASPYAFIVYQPTADGDPRDMSRELSIEAGTNVLSALIAALIASGLALGTGGRILAVAGMGVFATLAVNVPMWNWYRFPLEFTQGQAIGHIVGWLLAGIAIAWVLPKRN